jgi:hypothetical protein
MKYSHHKGKWDIHFQAKINQEQIYKVHIKGVIAVQLGLVMIEHKNHPNCEIKIHSVQFGMVG